MGGGAVLALAAFAVSIRCILAREYIVGDGFCMDVEWDRYCNFQRWALNKDFFVGDTLDRLFVDYSGLLPGVVLVFRFSSVSSTVAEVTKADFDGCTKALLPANPIRVHELSPVTVNLSTAGPVYIANTIQSCERQRFVINVNFPTPPTTTPSTPSPPSDATSKNPSPTSSAMTSSSTTPPPPPPPSSSHSGAVTGAVLGVAAFVAKIWIVTYCVQRRKKKKQMANNGQVHAMSGEGEDPMIGHEMNGKNYGMNN